LKLRLMGTQRVQMKGVLPWLVRWACRAAQGIFLFCLGCSCLGTKQNTFFLVVHYFISFVPIAQPKLGRQPCWVACLLICVSGSYIVYIVLGRERMRCFTSVYNVRTVVWKRRRVYSAHSFTVSCRGGEGLHYQFVYSTYSVLRGEKRVSSI
jgi:hypothetical protein